MVARDLGLTTRDYLRLGIEPVAGGKLLSVGVSASEDAYNLTLRIAATRVQQGINVRPKSTKG